MLIRRILYAMSKKTPGLHNLRKMSAKSVEAQDQLNQEQQQKLSPEDEVRRQFHLNQLSDYYNTNQQAFTMIGKVIFLQFLPPAIQGIRMLFLDPISIAFADQLDDLNLMLTMTSYITSIYRIKSKFLLKRQNTIYRCFLVGSLAAVMVIHANGAGIFARISAGFLINALLFSLQKSMSPVLNLNDKILRDPFDEDMEKLITKARLFTSLFFTILFCVQIYIMEEKQRLQKVLGQLNTQNKKQTKSN